MNEAINLDEVKRHIQCCIDTEECILCSFFRMGCDKSTFAKLMREAVQQLEDHIRDMAKMVPKWISVEDRLPERAVNVLCKCINEYDEDAFTIGWFSTRYHYWALECAVDESVRGRMEVTHWMPMPEPPKEEEV